MDATPNLFAIPADECAPLEHDAAILACASFRDDIQDAAHRLAATLKALGAAPHVACITTASNAIIAATDYLKGCDLRTQLMAAGFEVPPIAKDEGDQTDDL